MTFGPPWPPARPPPRPGHTLCERGLRPTQPFKRRSHAPRVHPTTTSGLSFLTWNKKTARYYFLRVSIFDVCSFATTVLPGHNGDQRHGAESWQPAKRTPLSPRTAPRGVPPSPFPSWSMGGAIHLSTKRLNEANSSVYLSPSASLLGDRAEPRVKTSDPPCVLHEAFARHGGLRK